MTRLGRQLIAWRTFSRRSARSVAPLKYLGRVCSSREARTQIQVLVETFHLVYGWYHWSLSDSWYLQASYATVFNAGPDQVRTAEPRLPSLEIHHEATIWTLNLTSRLAILSHLYLSLPRRPPSRIPSVQLQHSMMKLHYPIAPSDHWSSPSVWSLEIFLRLVMGALPAHYLVPNALLPFRDVSWTCPLTRYWHGRLSERFGMRVQHRANPFSFCMYRYLVFSQSPLCAAAIAAATLAHLAHLPLSDSTQPLEACRHPMLTRAPRVLPAKALA